MEIGTEKRGPGRPPMKVKPLDQILAPELEVKLESDQKEEPKRVVSQNLTPEELAIYGRVAAESDDWKTITEEGTNDFSLSRDVFELPEPAKKLRDKKEFAFRWITRKPERLDEMKNKSDPFKWWPVNSTQPVGKIFSSFLDPNMGCVSREDQMLVFKPWWMFLKERAYKDRLADAAYNSSALEGKDRQRIGDVELKAGKRSGNEDKQLRQEIKGSDIQFRGEEEVDAAAGRSYPGASESDLSVNE